MLRKRFGFVPKGIIIVMALVVFGGLSDESRYKTTSLRVSLAKNLARDVSIQKKEAEKRARVLFSASFDKLVG